MWKKLTAITMVFAALLIPHLAFAANVDPLDRGVCNSAAVASKPANQRPAVCQDKEIAGQNPISGANGVLSKIINLLTAIVGIIAVITLILAGLKFITSGANSDDVKNARERVIYSLVALVIAAIAQVMVRFIIGRVSN